MSGKFNVITVSRLVETQPPYLLNNSLQQKASKGVYLFLIHLFEINNSKVVWDYPINKYKRYSKTTKYLW